MDIYTIYSSEQLWRLLNLWMYEKARTYKEMPFVEEKGFGPFAKGIVDRNVEHFSTLLMLKHENA